MSEEGEKVTATNRFAGITPEVVENVSTGEKVEGWLALTHPPGRLKPARLAAIENRGKAEGDRS